MKRIIAAVLLASAFVAVPAAAAPIVYNLYGTFTGTRAGNAFTVRAVFSGIGDTSNPTSVFGNPAVTAVNFSSLGARTGETPAGVFSITSPAAFYTYPAGQYGAANQRLGITFNGDGNNALGLESAAYNGYSGLAPFRNTAGTVYFQNARFNTNGGEVIITGFTNGSFGTSAVPEPATWGMMILGFGLIGGLMRSAKRRSDAKFDLKIKRITAGLEA